MRNKMKKACNITEIYATLFGRVDNVITILDDMEKRHEFDWFHVNQVTEMLKAALLEAEEAYIEADEAKANSPVIVLPLDAGG